MEMCAPKSKGGMSFLDIHAFILAMLEKQAMRLIENSEFLCVCILRDKYYLDGNLLEAKLKKGPSFTWQSNMAGVNVLHHSYIWRAGDGQNINIQADAWMPIVMIGK